MKKPYLLSSSLALLFLFSSLSCQKRGCTDPDAINYDVNAKKDDNNCIYEQFDKQGLLQNLNNNYIIPSYSAYKNAILNLDSKVDDFIQDPNDSNLTLLRSQWHDALLTWQDVAFLNFGPSEYILLTSQNTSPLTLTVDSSISDGNWNFCLQLF